MRLLVLGGTRFVGRTLVEEAVRRGHSVTTLARGVSGDPPPGVESLHGDRTKEADLEVLRGREWDAAVDTSVLAPRHVGATARLLADQVGHYVYVSTVSVYPDFGGQPVDEASEVYECPADAVDVDYGPGKAGAERAVQEAFSGRALIVRPGVILGPYESPGRLLWWLRRIARGGQVLAPGSPDRAVRFVDVRDLAVWMLDNARRRLPGVVNVPGPRDTTTMGELLGLCVEATGSRAELVWLDDATLTEADVQPWTELPFWVPAGSGFGAWTDISDERARLAGIRYHPVRGTVFDTWRWLRGVPEPSLAPDLGLDPDKERRLLAAQP
ncbi:MAG: NAD-dependent epimerase/dehydratase family protein [Streptosporangiales bacterium]|nr:NAD-dependent epimerase/dehydratase family protein [Streptosporangiales bacterium]